MPYVSAMHGMVLLPQRRTRGGACKDTASANSVLIEVTVVALLC